ncbi:hypothetical protein PAHAL_2G464000 [Panicum hallii]|uniref:Secreted protein n=1 Tax=Panicum hallii TaxID=206008 RepID=A0A2T8KT28_9POAL|nr:hypothetical protein PAHAL_2G464000 [Panicum hallii]
MPSSAKGFQRSSWLALLPCFLCRSSSRAFWFLDAQKCPLLRSNQWKLLSAVALKPIQCLRSAREDEQNTVR